VHGIKSELCSKHTFNFNYIEIIHSFSKLDIWKVYRKVCEIV